MKNFIIIISLLFLNKKINALAFNNDSLKNKYELNDPRNPNCPCHKYQKLADEEFNLRQTQRAQRIKDFIEQKTNSKETGFANASAGNLSKNTTKSNRFKSLLFSKRKNKAHKIFNFNKGHRGKKRHFVRHNKNISSCFRWR